MDHSPASSPIEAPLRLLLGAALTLLGIIEVVKPELLPTFFPLWAWILVAGVGLWLLSGRALDKAYFVIRLALGLTFVWAAVDKIIHPDQFARIIYNYHLLPGEYINVFALLLPWVELLTGVMVILGLWEKAAVVIIAGMLAMFIVALSIAIARGVNIECGCFSTTSKAKAPVLDLIIRDAIMLVACGLILWTRRSWLALDRRPAQTQTT